MGIVGYSFRYDRKFIIIYLVVISDVHKLNFHVVLKSESLPPLIIFEKDQPLSTSTVCMAMLPQLPKHC